MFRTATAVLAALLSLGAAPVLARSENAGTYLAGRHAGYESDFVAASEYFTRALALDAQNADLMEKALTAEISLGRFDKARAIVQRMEAVGDLSPLANIVKLTTWAKAGDYVAIDAAYEAGFSLGGLLDGLVQAWSALGKGDTAAALAGFDDLAAQQGLRNLALYHKALVYAASGDYAGADEILSGKAAGPLSISRRGVLAHVEVLSRLGRNPAALELLQKAFGNSPSPVFSALAERLEAGEELRFDVATDARTGMAEAFYSLAQALLPEAANSLTLLYTRSAVELNPDHVDALLLTASLLEGEKQYDLATQVYDRVPRDHPAYLEAEFGRADALRFSGRTDAAIEVLHQLAKTYPDMMQVQVALGDVLRREERWPEANAAYDKAIALMPQPEPQDWQTFFARGIVLERQKQWPAAEADFRVALGLAPDQPQVLNYLGYSLVERHEKLDEALAMIEKAVEARPDDAYITDSLGWALYRLGRFQEAVGPMERATELMATDPVVNDHLGDVYWVVGRKREAEFQWRRALSFIDNGGSTEDVSPERIRRKLEVGLDQVLAEEAARPKVPDAPVPPGNGGN